MKIEYSSAREVFDACLDLSSADQREALLEELAGSSPALARAAAELLIAHDAAEGGSFFSADPKCDFETQAGGQLTLPAEAAEGSTIGCYKLLEKIGEGGMGVVYMAEQEEPVRRKVALKVIKLGMDTKQVVARFEAERQALAMMDNPHIAKLLDAGVTESGRPYFVMELVRGVSIVQYCDGNKLSIPDRLKLFIPVCQAIQHAHQKGVIHRDIKPTNVLVAQNGDHPHPMVIDFGVAKATNQRLTEKTLFTRFAQMIGTPAYMSPEQAEMSIHDVDTRSDIYSLGVLLYELLTGTTPFPEQRLRSAGFAEMQRIIKEEEPVRPSTMVSQMDATRQTVAANRHIEPEAIIRAFRGDLDWIVLKAIEKDRDRRYETANGLAIDIKRHLKDEPVSAAAPSFSYRLRKAARRHRLALIAGLAVGSSLVLGSGISIWQAIEAKSSRRAALIERGRAIEGERRALDGERNQRLIAYASDMKVAGVALAEGNLGRVSALLGRYLPAPGDVGDMRGVEWSYIWQASRGDEIHTFEQDSIITSLTLSDDGTLLATGNFGGEIKLYDLGARRLLRSLEGAAKEHSPADLGTLSPDGRLLAAERDGTLIVWDAQTGAVVFEDSAGRAPVAFSPDSKSLAVYTDDRVAVWDVATWTRRLLGEARDPWNNRIAFTPSGDRIFYRNKKTIEMWNLRDRAPEAPEHVFDLSPTAMAVHGGTLAVGTVFGMVHLFDLETKELVRDPVRVEASRVHAVAFSPDGRTLATGGNDQVIRIWDLESFEELQTLRGHEHEIWELRFSSDGRLLASASADQTVKLWKPGSPDVRDGAPLIRQDLICRALSESGDVLRFTDQEELPPRTTWDAPLPADTHRTDHRFNLRTHAWDQVPRRDGGAIAGTTSMAWRTGQDQFLFGKPDGTIVITDGVIAESIQLAEHPVRPLFLSSSDRYLLANLEPAGREPYTILWDRDADEMIARFDPAIPPSLNGRWPMQAISPDEKILAYAGAGGYNQLIRLWSIEERRDLATLEGHSWLVEAIEFSPDGKLLASGSYDGTCRLWDIEAGSAAEPHLLRGHRAGVSQVSFSPDGRTLITASDDLTQKLWSVATGQEMLSRSVSYGAWWNTCIPAYTPNPNRLLSTVASGEETRLRIVAMPSLEDIDSMDPPGG